MVGVALMIPLMCAGIAFYLHRRRTKRRALDAQLAHIEDYVNKRDASEDDNRIEDYANGGRRLMLLARGDATDQQLWTARVQLMDAALDRGLRRAGAPYRAANLRSHGGSRDQVRLLVWSIPSPYGAVVLDDLDRNLHDIEHLNDSYRLISDHP